MVRSSMLQVNAARSVFSHYFPWFSSKEYPNSACLIMDFQRFSKDFQWIPADSPYISADFPLIFHGFSRILHGFPWIFHRIPRRPLPFLGQDFFLKTRVRNNGFLRQNFLSKNFLSITPAIFPLCVSYFMESRVGPDMTEVRVLVQFGTFGVLNWLFEVIS